MIRIEMKGSGALVRIVALRAPDGDPPRVGVAPDGEVHEVPIVTDDEIAAARAAFDVMADAVPTGTTTAAVVNGLSLMVAGLIARNGIPLSFFTTTIAQFLQSNAVDQTDADTAEVRRSLEMAAISNRLALLDDREHRAFCAAVIPLDRAGLLALEGLALMIADPDECHEICPPCLAAEFRQSPGKDTVQ